MEIRNSLVDLLKFHALVLSTSQVFMGLLGICLAFMSYIALANSENGVAKPIMLVVSAAIFVVLFAFQMRFVLVFVLVHRDKNFYRPRIVELLPTSIRDSTDAVVLEVQWFAMQSVKRIGALVYVRLSPGAANCIPKRAFPDAAAFEHFSSVALALFRQNRVMK